jgi:hypothetical protein
MLKKTFDNKSSHNKINNNYIYFLIRRKVKRLSKKNQRRRTLRGSTV